MIFKELKHLLPETITVIVDDAPLHHYWPERDDFDYFEVVSIRAGMEYYDTYEEEVVEVTLKETITKHIGMDKYVRESKYISSVSCEQGRGK